MNVITNNESITINLKYFVAVLLKRLNVHSSKQSDKQMKKNIKSEKVIVFM